LTIQGDFIATGRHPDLETTLDHFEVQIVWAIKIG
jgi:hypothetical protein